ncbi:LPXTG cell wall anchor domain-containing protein [Streptomyces lydicus]|uniref:LPXTG cell wall anchor domain-containing protein n=1 Tax=Streptomyces lydicus TaxID=47763 RepID=UPI0009A16E78|nr:LPXTG cell wall anchor domain-containing protein [Streptomyces lydicus]
MKNTGLRIPKRWRLAGRVLAAVGIASAVTVAGLPADAAPRPVTAKIRPGAKRCDESNLGRTEATTPRNSGFPNDPLGSNFSKWPGNPKNYNYDLPGQAYDGLPAPSAADKAKALSQVPGDTTKNYEKWKRIANASGDPADRKYEIYARFFNNTEGRTWDDWFKNRYIVGQMNNRKGAAFEGQLVRDFRLVGPDWLCEVTVDLIDANGHVVDSRRYDAYNTKRGEFHEFKSNSELKNKQIAKDRKIARLMPDKTFRFTGAKPFSENDRKKIDNFNRYVKRLRPGAVNPVRGNQRIYNSVPRTKPIRGYSRYDRWFAPGCQGSGSGTTTLASLSSPGCGTRGPLNERVNNSGRTPAEARRIQASARRFDSRGVLPRGGPGGVDFTTLELRYVGGLGKGKGMQYSMRADQQPDPDNNPGYGGKAAIQLSSDAMFTWLALTPDKFWVNLNPDQPDRVMDTAFASTDAGRVLLEADLQMKHDFFKTMDPKTDLGRRFWAALPQVDGRPCFSSIRNWIEPKPAKVREQDGGIYILDAPLRLKSVQQDFGTQPGGGEDLCHPTKAQQRQAQAVINQMIVPAVEKTINTAPQYADLRRVYTSRVAAEYIRRTDAQHPTDFHRFINSNNVKPWPLRAPHQNWDKDALFRKYRKIFINGEFKYNVNTARGVQVMIVGGVDFSKAPKHNITNARFNIENRDLDNTTRNSVKSDDTSYRDTDTLYLGGGPATATGDDPGGDPTPTPKPTPTHPGKPTHQPTTPAPDPTTPGGHTSGGGNGQPPAKDPSGDLAHTGSDTPIGLISGIAAALAAAGGGLVWWMRRRRTAPEG